MEQTAFLERAINEYGKATYNYAYRLTIRVYRAWRSFKPGTSFLSWIYRIVTNLHRDELRRRKGRYQEEIPEDHELQEHGGGRPLAVEPIEEYVERQLSEPVSKALADLATEQHQIVLLADVEGERHIGLRERLSVGAGCVEHQRHDHQRQDRDKVAFHDTLLGAPCSGTQTEFVSRSLQRLG